MTFDSFRGRPGWRVALAAACIVFPVLVYAVAFYWLAGRAGTPADVAPEAIGLAFAEKGGPLFALEMAARERYLLTSAAMFAVSAGALAYALSRIYQRRGGAAALIGALAAAATGAVSALSAGNRLRTLIVEAPLALAETQGASHGLTGLSEGISLFVAVNTFTGLAAVAAFMLRFADLALGAPDDDMGEAGFARRAATLRETMLMASAVLTSATIATCFFYQYPLALMTPESRAVFGTLSGVASIRWGAAYTAILAAASAPAIIALIAERRRAMADGALPPGAAATGGLSEDDVQEYATGLAALAGVIAPAGAAPVSDLLPRGARRAG
ncbi:MAG: hypothetical protein ACK5MQ_05905, partial [Pikeienuella sp.]